MGWSFISFNSFMGMRPDLPTDPKLPRPRDDPMKAGCKVREIGGTPRVPEVLCLTQKGVRLPLAPKCNRAKLLLEIADTSDFLNEFAHPPMKQAYEIFQDMKTETALSVFQYLRDQQREVYKATLSSLASNRKLRPVVIQRKPVPDQIDWMLKHVKLRGSAEVAAQVLQLWLLKGHAALLTGFLDGLGIEHDGEGAAEDLPDELDPKKLKNTVASLLKSHDPEVVAIYLHIFQLQRSDGWAELATLIEATPELRLGSPPPPPAPAPEEGGEEAPAKPAAKKAPAKKAAKQPAGEDASAD